MNRKLRFSREVAQEITSVLAYALEHFGAQKLEQYKRLIRRALKEISAHADHPPAKCFRDVYPQVWTLHISHGRQKARHLLVYHIMDREFVEVTRFLHDSMDLQQHLPEEFRSAD